MAKVQEPQMLTASRLADGDVLYWRAGDWVLALADGETEVVCIAGRNELAQRKLEGRFGDNPRVRVLGFTDQMSDWMAAADAMIHATAGLTVLEAHIRGCPVISYGFSAGHLRANNAAFERFGIAEVARSDHELESTLRHVTAERRSPDSSFASLPSIASRALAVRPRVRQEPVWRLRTARAVAVASANPGSDLVRMSSSDEIDLLLVDGRRPLLGGGVPREEVGAVLASAKCSAGELAGYNVAGMRSRNGADPSRVSNK